jgi:hypothetical protein
MTGGTFETFLLGLSMIVARHAPKKRMAGKPLPANLAAETNLTMISDQSSSPGTVARLFFGLPESNGFLLAGGAALLGFA